MRTHSARPQSTWVKCERQVHAVSSMEEGVLMIKKSLAISEVIQILENANEDQCISAPPSKPKASQVYLYKVDDAAKQGTLL